MENNKNKHLTHYAIGATIGIVVTLLIMCIFCCKNMGMMKKELHTMDMSSMMADMNANLAGKQGDEFDKAFINEMIVHHEGAVDMAELALTNAKHPEIKTLANAIISAQTTEISQMKGWLEDWYGNEPQSSLNANQGSQGAHH